MEPDSVFELATRRLALNATAHNERFPPTLLDLMNGGPDCPVFRSMCSYLSIAEVLNLARTCNAFSQLYHIIFPWKWNVDKVLKRFVNNPKKLREQLGKSDALISGSVALQFFECCQWDESDMDVFIKEGAGAASFAAYIKENREVSPRDNPTFLL
jgi:hypothetical protein